MSFPGVRHVVLCLVCLQAAAVQAAVFRFDMGKPGSPVRPGFERVTAASTWSAERGWGWQSPDGLKEHDQVLADGWRNKGVRAVDVNRDMVYSARPNAFRVDAPPGRYRVLLISGSSGSFAGQYFDFTAAARGASARARVAGNCEYRKTVLDTEVRPNDPGLSVSFAPRSLWLVNAIIVYPVDQEARARKEFLDDLDQEVWTMPLAEWKKWEEVPHSDTRPLPKIGDAERRRGYVVYVPHYLEVVYPNTKPRLDWLRSDMRAFACPGEYEPVTFAVYPLRDIAGARVTVGDLRSARGDTIPSAAVEARRVRYVKTRLSFRKDFAYKIVPDLLETFDRVDLKRGRNERFWLTLRVPDNARPGVYTGPVTFGPQGAEPSRLALRVRVLPFRLERNPDRLYSISYLDSRSICRPRDAVSEAYFERKGALERRDLLAHGIMNHDTFLTRKADANGDPVIGYDRMDKVVARYRKFGFSGALIVKNAFWRDLYRKHVGPFPPRHEFKPVPEDSPFLKALVAKVVEIERERKKRGWPVFIYYPIDEPGGCRDFANQLLKAYRQAGGRTFCTLDPSTADTPSLLRNLDVLASSHYSDPDRIAAFRRKFGTRFLVYPNSLTFYCDRTAAAGARMTTGFGLWRSGYSGVWIFKYSSTSGDPYNYLDPPYGDVMVRTAPDGAPVPPIMWECMREGLDDDRYIYTLESRIARARKSADKRLLAAAVRAEKVLQEIRGGIKPQREYVYDGLWSGPEFDVYRSMVARQILNLIEAEGGR